MRVGIIGLPQTGKKTLFELLTGTKAAVQPAAAKKALDGIVEIQDGRFDSLAGLYNPKKATRARIEIELLPKIDAAVIREGSIFRDIAGMDALCHIVRVFGDESIYHVSGSVDPGRDIEMVNSELILHDLLFIEKRLDRIEQGKKKNREEQLKKEEDVLLRFKAHLEMDLPLRTLETSPEERKVIAGYPFITLKEMIVALNVSDAEIASEGAIADPGGKYSAQGIRIMHISAKLEAEIAALDSAAEKAEFLRDAGIAEPAVNLLTRLCMEALGYISFFTVGADEVRQWLIRRGAMAPEAGAAIHTDIQRGFIRAEVIKYADLMEHKTEDALRKAGRHLVMGKDYTVEDGDIINFRFNV